MNSDMTKYCYQYFENAYNIGWNANYDKTAGNREALSGDFMEKLSRYCERPFNRDLNGKCRVIEVDGKKYVKGTNC